MESSCYFIKTHVQQQLKQLRLSVRHVLPRLVPDKNDGFCIRNDKLCIKNDESCNANAGTYHFLITVQGTCSNKTHHFLRI